MDYTLAATVHGADLENAMFWARSKSFFITTIIGKKFGKTVFGIPNETLKELAAKMIPAAYSDVHKIDERVFDINDGLCDFAEKGEWRGFIDILSQIVKENFAVRDSVEGEKVVQSTIVALLTASGGPYYIKHEREAGISKVEILY